MNYPLIPYVSDQKNIWESNLTDPIRERTYTLVFVAKNWNIARIMALGGGWESPPRIERDYKTEHSTHREKRRKYVERCIQDIEKMPDRRKATLLLSEHDLAELKPHFKLNNVHILDSEICPKSKKPRLKVTIVKY